MKKIVFDFGWLAALIISGSVAVGPASAQEGPAGCTVEVEVVDIIGPATVDLLTRVEAFAAKEKCSSIFLTINTPGGSLESTRRLVSMILNSPIPYLCLVAPSGAHAGSAGAIILQGCHVNGAMTGTNLGAATPILMGQEMGKDLRQKIMNDTTSWLESLTKLRGRNDQFGRDIITEAKAVTADEALKLKAIDYVGGSKEDFLNFAKERKVKLSENQETTVAVGVLKKFDLDTRFKVISMIADPQLAYLLFLGSLGLLYFEFTHPGGFVAGVIGSIGLVVALIAMDKLNVEWAGLFLIILGIALLVAEMFLPTFGILGLGGLVSFVLGSIFLFDPAKTGGYRLPLSLILPVAVFFCALFIGVSILALRTWKVKKHGAYDDLVGENARVTKIATAGGQTGYIELRGETWKFESPVALNLNDQVKVVGYQGLVLKVHKES